MSADRERQGKLEERRKRKLKRIRKRLQKIAREMEVAIESLREITIENKAVCASSPHRDSGENPAAAAPLVEATPRPVSVLNDAPAAGHQQLESNFLSKDGLRSNTILACLRIVIPGVKRLFSRVEKAEEARSSTVVSSSSAADKRIDPVPRRDEGISERPVIAPQQGQTQSVKTTLDAASSRVMRSCGPLLDRAVAMCLSSLQNSQSETKRLCLAVLAPVLESICIIEASTGAEAPVGVEKQINRKESAQFRRNASQTTAALVEALSSEQPQTLRVLSQVVQRVRGSMQTGSEDFDQDFEPTPTPTPTQLPPAPSGLAGSTAEVRKEITEREPRNTGPLRSEDPPAAGVDCDEVVELVLRCLKQIWLRLEQLGASTAEALAELLPAANETIHGNAETFAPTDAPAPSTTPDGDTGPGLVHQLPSDKNAQAQLALLARLLKKDLSFTIRVGRWIDDVPDSPGPASVMAGSLTRQGYTQSTSSPSLNEDLGPEPGAPPNSPHAVDVQAGLGTGSSATEFGAGERFSGISQLLLEIKEFASQAKLELRSTSDQADSIASAPAGKDIRTDGVTEKPNPGGMDITPLSNEGRVHQNERTPVSPLATVRQKTLAHSPKRWPELDSHLNQLLRSLETGLELLSEIERKAEAGLLSYTKPDSDAAPSQQNLAGELDATELTVRVALEFLVKIRGLISDEQIVGSGSPKAPPDAFRPGVGLAAGPNGQDATKEPERFSPEDLIMLAWGPAIVELIEPALHEFAKTLRRTVLHGNSLEGELESPSTDAPGRPVGANSTDATPEELAQVTRFIKDFAQKTLLTLTSSESAIVKTKETRPVGLQLSAGVSAPFRIETPSQVAVATLAEGLHEFQSYQAPGLDPDEQNATAAKSLELIDLACQAAKRNFHSKVASLREGAKSGGNRTRSELSLNIGIKNMASNWSQLSRIEEIPPAQGPMSTASGQDSVTTQNLPSAVALIPEPAELRAKRIRSARSLSIGIKNIAPNFWPLSTPDEIRPTPTLLELYPSQLRAALKIPGHKPEMQFNDDLQKQQARLTDLSEQERKRNALALVIGQKAQGSPGETLPHEDSAQGHSLNIGINTVAAYIDSSARKVGDGDPGTGPQPVEGGPLPPSDPHDID